MPNRQGQLCVSAYTVTLAIVPTTATSESGTTADAVQSLLARVWPGITPALASAHSLGAGWHRISRPFVHEIDGVLVAHAGLVELPLVIDGQPTLVAGIHAVCTDPRNRGQGFARRVLDMALTYADSRYQTLVLHAAQPRLYEGFGFRPVDQTVFHTDIAVTRAATTSVPLSSKSMADVERLRSTFAERAPVSMALGVGAAADVFILDEILACERFARLSWLADLNAVVAAEVYQGTLYLYDIVAPELPSLGDIVARMPGRIDHVEVFFTVDRWDAARFGTRPMEPPETMMVRGPFTRRSEIALPPLARC